MPDDLKKKIRDRNFINVHEDWERRYWQQKLETNKQGLENAVRAVGPGAKAVRQYLKDKRR